MTPAPSRRPLWRTSTLQRLRPLLFVLCLVPALRWLWLAWQAQLTANPQEFLIRSSGLWALIILLVTLGITPARRLLKQPALLVWRRMLGLFSFFYTLLHMAGWALWERGL